MFENSVNLIRVQILLVDCERKHCKYMAHKLLSLLVACLFMCLCSLSSLLRIPRLITVQNKEDFSALIPKVSLIAEVITLEINYLIFV